MKNTITLLAAILFPWFGITAFCLLWLHAISGVFENWLRVRINFDRFVSITATIILICIIAHPLLLLITFNFDIASIFMVYGALPISLGIIGWLLLISYDLWKPFKRYNQFFVRHWNKVLIISNIGFIIIFFHSLSIGSNLQSGPLRIVWIFLGITGALSIFYTYVIKKRPS